MRLSSTLNKSMHKYETAIVTILLKRTIKNAFSTEESTTRKCGNCECIATWGRPTSRQSLSTVIMTPIPRFKLDNLSVHVLLRFKCWYVTLRCDFELCPCDLDLWPLTVNICSVSSVTWWNSVSNFSEIKQSAAELLRFHCLTLWPWTCITCWPMPWYNVHKV